MQDEPSLLLIVCANQGDAVVTELCRRYQGPSAVLANLCQAQLSVDVGMNRRSDRISLRERILDVDALHAIVVSGLSCSAPPEHSVDDSRYAEFETFAAWMALLRQARCRVVNRPAFIALPPGLSPVQIRAAARKAGVPTVTDEFCAGAGLARYQSESAPVACVDLDTHVGFWLKVDMALGSRRIYSVTNLTMNDTQVIVAFVGGQCSGYSLCLRESEPARLLQASVLGEANEAIGVVSAMLGLEYGFFSFRVGSHSLEFCRAYPYSVASGCDPIVEWTASSLMTAIEVQ